MAIWLFSADLQGSIALTGMARLQDKLTRQRLERPAWRRKHPERQRLKEIRHNREKGKNRQEMQRWYGGSASRHSSNHEAAATRVAATAKRTGAASGAFCQRLSSRVEKTKEKKETGTAIKAKERSG